MPEEYDIEFLLYQLTDGDGTKRKFYEDNWTPEDAVLWFYLRQYDNWAETKMLEK